MSERISPEVAKQAERSSRDEIYAFIEEDLKFAAKELPESMMMKFGTCRPVGSENVAG